MWQQRYWHVLGQAVEALPEEKRRLGLLCVLALLGHVGAFLVLRIQVPPAAVPSFERVEVRLELTPEAGAGEIMASLQNPALMLHPPRKASVEPTAPGRSLREVRPLRQEQTTVARVLLPALGEFEFLPTLDSPVAARAQETLVPQPLKMTFRETVTVPVTAEGGWEMDAPLRERLKEGVPAVPMFEADLLEQMQPVVVRIMVDSAGRVRHALLIGRSGNQAGSEAVLHWARSLRFNAAARSGEETWATVTVYPKFAEAAR